MSDTTKLIFYIVAGSLAMWGVGGLVSAVISLSRRAQQWESACKIWQSICEDQQREIENYQDAVNDLMKKLHSKNEPPQSNQSPDL